MCVLQYRYIYNQHKQITLETQVIAILMIRSCFSVFLEVNMWYIYTYIQKRIYLFICLFTCFVFTRICDYYPRLPRWWTSLPPWRFAGFSFFHNLAEKDVPGNFQGMPDVNIPGWWFGTFFIFPYIGNNHPNWLIFFRGVAQPPTS